MARMPTMVDAYVACMTRGRHTIAPQIWDGLVGLWLPYVGIQGSRLLDWSGQHRHGTPANTSWTLGEAGYALELDGGTNEITCGTTRLTGGFTFHSLIGVPAAWVRDYPIIMNINDGTSANIGRLMARHAAIADECHFSVRRSGVWYSVVGSVLSPGLHTVTGICDCGQQTLFIMVDGIPINSAAGPSTFAINESLDISGIGSSAFRFNGEIYGCAAWNRPLSVWESAFLRTNLYALVELAEEWAARSAAYQVPLSYILHTMEAA